MILFDEMLKNLLINENKIKNLKITFSVFLDFEKKFRKNYVKNRNLLLKKYKHIL